MGGEINNFFFSLNINLIFSFRIKKNKFYKTENDKYYFELYIKNNKINVIFNPNNNKNLISITLRNKKYAYYLENKSKDYHNNFIIKKIAV